MISMNNKKKIQKKLKKKIKLKFKNLKMNYIIRKWNKTFKIRNLNNHSMKKKIKLIIFNH